MTQLTRSKKCWGGTLNPVVTYLTMKIVVALNERYDYLMLSYQAHSSSSPQL